MRCDTYVQSSVNNNILRLAQWTILLDERSLYLPNGQSSPGIWHSGQQPSNDCLHIPQSASLASHFQKATATHFLIRTFISTVSPFTKCLAIAGETPYQFEQARLGVITKAVRPTDTAKIAFVAITKYMVVASL